MLDLGCGGGWLLEAFAEHGVDPLRLHGIDLIKTRVEVARRRVPKADVRVADADSLPFEGGRFQLVTMLTALSSTAEERLEPALAEVRRVTAPGGLVLCYEARFANPLNRSVAGVPPRVLEAALGPARSAATLTGFPPLARRLGPLTERLYPSLSKLAPTHRISTHEPGR